MKKYLLLRDNRESGPHTFEQMGSFGLHPLDLIWIENESTSWKYPEEIEELKDLVTHDASTTVVQRPDLSTEKVFVSLPPEDDLKEEDQSSWQYSSLPVDETLSTVEDDNIIPLPEFKENYRTPKQKQLFGSPGFLDQRMQPVLLPFSLVLWWDPL